MSPFTIQTGPQMVKTKMMHGNTTEKKKKHHIYFQKQCNTFRCVQFQNFAILIWRGHLKYLFSRNSDLIFSYTTME